MAIKDYNAYAWDFETNTVVNFRSTQFCCGSCIDDHELGDKLTMENDPCCCVHQGEYDKKRSI